MTPKLKDLFVYPIERYIPAVAKVGDTTEQTMATELREYVVTGPIERALIDFLEVYSESRTAPTDQIGVWISGFFGSGKSHFAKVLSYLLTNPTVEGRSAREMFIDRLAGSPRRHEIEGLLHRAGLLDSHVMMFNIKTEQDQQTKDESVSQILYRRHLAERGLSTDPVVASLELSLIDRELYEPFQAEVERRTGNPWVQEREDFLFVRPTVADVLQTIAPDAYRSREEALGALEMVEHGQRLTVSDLAERLVDYVDEMAETGDPERPPRLVFILDEVSQFIPDAFSRATETLMGCRLSPLALLLVLAWGLVTVVTWFGARLVGGRRGVLSPSTTLRTGLSKEGFKAHAHLTAIALSAWVALAALLAPLPALLSQVLGDNGYLALLFEALPVFLGAAMGTVGVIWLTQALQTTQRLSATRATLAVLLATALGLALLYGLNLLTDGRALDLANTLVFVFFLPWPG